MIKVSIPSNLPSHIGDKFKSVENVLVSHELIDAFLEVSGDRQSIHTTEAEERIVPGNLLISLIPRLLQSCLSVDGFERCVTVKYSEIRFKSPLIAGEYLTLSGQISDVRERSGNVFLTVDVSLLEWDSVRTILTAQVTDLYEVGPISG
jgi:acyl dehydratase